MSSPRGQPRVLRHAAHSQSPWGSTEPLVTFLTFFMFSITPDVVTLRGNNGGASQREARPPSPRHLPEVKGWLRSRSGAGF